MKISTRRLFVRGSAEAPAGCRGPALARKVVLPRRPEPWVKARLSQEDFLVSRSAGAEWSEKRLAHSAASDKSRCSRNAPRAGGQCSGEAINPGASNCFRAPGVSLRHDNL